MTDSTSIISPDEANRKDLLGALENVLTSSTFTDVYRLKKFLDYVVKETIEGRGGRLKGVGIACDVFDKNDPADAASTTVVRVEAGRLRRRLKDYYDNEGAADPIRISIPKGGYAATFSFADLTEGAGNNEQGLSRWKPGLKSPVAWIIVILVSLLVYLIPRPSSEIAELQHREPAQPLIAIMPFENLTEITQGDLIARGLTEDLVIDLGSIPTIDVISASSVWPFIDRKVSTGEIYESLGAGYVLQGSIKGNPPKLQVTSQLFDSLSGRQLWAKRFEDVDFDSGLIQQELVHRLVSSLSIELDESKKTEFNQRYTSNKEAWSLYKQAMNLANPPSDKNRLLLAKQAFDKVIEMDPEFVGGYAGSAYTLAFVVYFDHEGDLEADAIEANRLASQARMIDPGFGLTLSAKAFLHLANGEFGKALESSEKAVISEPNDAYINAYHGFMMGTNGDLEGGIQYVERALRLDPLNYRSPYLNILGVLNYLAGNYTGARDNLLLSLQRGGPGGPGPMRFLAASHSILGETVKAESVLHDADQLQPGEESWKQWLLSTFADPDIPQRVIVEIDSIRAAANP